MAKSDARVYALPGLGAKLVAAREDAALTQAAAAAAASVDRPSLSLYERDLKAPTLPVLYRLAAAYGVPPCDLLPPADPAAAAPKPRAKRAKPARSE